MKRQVITLTSVLTAAVVIHSKAQNIFPSSGNVGIGTTSPQQALSLASSGSTWLSFNKVGAWETGFQFKKSNNVQFYFYSDNYDADALKIQSTAFSDENDSNPRIHIPFNNKNIYFAQSGGGIGIGTTTVTERLTVSGGGIALDADQPLRGGGKWLISGNNDAVTVGTANYGVDVRLMAGANDPRVIIDGVTGGVGIGTLTPGAYKLAVEGKIGAREVNVTTGAWADHVFREEYSLRSVYEVEKFIENNHHLPDVPSEKEVLANGQNLGEMNAILLKKIEELTLYVIDQQKQIDALKKKMEQE